jgi:hypothetical protein
LLPSGRNGRRASSIFSTVRLAASPIRGEDVSIQQFQEIDIFDAIVQYSGMMRYRA